MSAQMVAPRRLRVKRVTGERPVPPALDGEDMLDFLYGPCGVDPDADLEPEPEDLR